MDQITNFAELYVIFNKKIDTSILNSSNKKTDFIASMNIIVTQNKEKLTNLKKKNTEISKLFSSDISDKISSCIDKYIEQIDKYQQLYDENGEEFTQDEMDKINEFAENVNKIDDELTELIKASYEDYSSLILENLKSGNIKEAELSQLIAISNLDNEQKDVMLQSLNNYKNTEQQAVEDEKGKKSEGTTASDSTQDVGTSEQDKEDDVEYVTGTDYHNRVQDKKKSDRISELDILIDDLYSKNNLSFIEAMKLYNLVKEREELVKSNYTKKSLASNIREKKMSKLDSKISSYSEQLQTELEKQEQMKSGIFRYFSNRKVGKLREKMTSLQEKFGDVKSAQAAAAIHAYDAQNRMISFKAKFLTAKQVAVNTAVMVKNEFNNLRADFSRFISKKSRVQDMRNGDVTINATPSTINLRLPEQLEAATISM